MSLWLVLHVGGREEEGEDSINRAGRLVHGFVGKHQCSVYAILVYHTLARGNIDLRILKHLNATIL